jgi:hypothetical protein
MLALDPTDTYTEETNKSFIRRWNLEKQSKVIEMVGSLYADICNVRTHLLRGLRMKVKLTKAKHEFYFMNKDGDSKVVFKFLDAQLLVKRARPNPPYLIAHNKVLLAGAIAKYNFTRVEFKSFTFARGSQSLSIDNAVLGTVIKRLLFTIMKNKDFFGSVDTNPFQL